MLTLKGIPEVAEGAIHRRVELEGRAGPGLDPASWPASTAVDHLRDVAGGSPLEIVATMRQIRRQRVFAGGETRAELSLDELEALAEADIARRAVALEGELLAGEPSDLRALADALAATLDLHPARESKLSWLLEAVRGR